MQRYQMRFFSLNTVFPAVTQVKGTPELDWFANQDSQVTTWESVEEEVLLGCA